MPETLIGRTQEAPKVERSGYQILIEKSLDRMARRPEVADAVNWYKESVARLPEMMVDNTPLTGEGGWAGEITESGEVDKITGSHFDIPGQQVTIIKPDGSIIRWNQPIIRQKESPITLPSPEGEISLQASGFVGLLIDTKGRMLLTVGQESAAQTYKKALVRTPFQTSATKLSALLSGDRDKDPNLANVLDEVGQGKSMQELFASGEIETFPLAPADANRISATNIGFIMEVADPAVQEKLAGESNRWCTPDEVDGLIRVGVVNGHTAALYAAAKWKEDDFFHPFS